MPLLPLTFYLLALFLSLLFLAKSAEFLLAAITRLGVALHFSKFLTGFVLLGISTSFPEMSIAVNSALSSTPELSLGNLLGANIVLLTLVSGIAAVFSGGVIVRQEFRQALRIAQIALLIFSPIVVLIDSRLSLLDGLFLFLAYIGYFIYIYKLRPHNGILQHSLLNHKVFHSAFLSLLGIIGVAVSAKAVVFVSLKLAAMLSAPPLAIGLLVLSIGTNLPEITIAVSAIKMRETGLILGDVLGSAATNTLIVALLGLLSPFHLDFRATYQTASIFIVIALLAFILFTRSKNHLSKYEGLALLGIYGAYLAFELLSGSLTA